MTTTPSDTPSISATPTITPTATPSTPPTDTPSPTPSGSPSQTPTTTTTLTPSFTPTQSPTFTPGQPQLTISKTSDSRVVPGGTLVYTISYGNIGSGTATGVVITETVPDHTRFNGASSTLGWSCAAGSPPTTPCTHAVPDLAPGDRATLLYAVTVDNPLDATSIRNNVKIADAQGGSSDGGDTSFASAPAPALAPWAIAAALAMLAAMARRRLRR